MHIAPTLSPGFAKRVHENKIPLQQVATLTYRNIALTYANNLSHDSPEVELQKIYSIYALSRFLDLSYVHSPIAKITFHDAARYNEIFFITSNVTPPSSAIVHVLPEANLEWLWKLKDSARDSRDFHLVKIISSHQITNKHPEMLHYVKEASPFTALQSAPFRIAMHLEQDALLPKTYSFSMALHAIEILCKLGISFVCELFTKYSHDLQEFEALPHLRKIINSDPIYSLQSLATADLLIMSHSPLSYVAAILNKKGIIIYHPHKNHPLSTWLDTSDCDSFHQKLTTLCERWKK